MRFLPLLLLLPPLCLATALDTLPNTLSPLGFDRRGEKFELDHCAQVHCDVSTCASSMDEAFRVASEHLTLFMGPDCGAWSEGSPSKAPGKSCANGKAVWIGDYVIWRAFSNALEELSVSFVADGDFLGAKCGASDKVACLPKRQKMVPDPNTGVCLKWWSPGDN